MVAWDALQAQVDEAYGALALPSWPDPHPERDPREEEYSRVSDPDRYVVLHARAQCWADVLGAVDGVVVTASDDGVTLVRPRGHGAVAIRFSASRVPLDPGPGALPTLSVSAVGPTGEVLVDAQPDCGCDACDDGSAGLVRAVDQAVRRVVATPLVALRGRGWRGQWYGDGGGETSSRGDAPAAAAVMEWCRALADGEAVDLPAGVEVVVSGRPWW